MGLLCNRGFNQTTDNHIKRIANFVRNIIEPIQLIKFNLFNFPKYHHGLDFKDNKMHASRLTSWVLLGIITTKTASQ